MTTFTTRPLTQLKWPPFRRDIIKLMRFLTHLDASAFQNETDFEQTSYWPTYFNTVRSEEQWTEIELNKVSYAKDATDFIISPESEIEAEILESQIIMATDETGQSTPMACGIMLVKSIQGRSCSHLLKVLYDSGGSKSMIKKSVLPKGIKLTVCLGSTNIFFYFHFLCLIWHVIKRYG